MMILEDFESPFALIEEANEGLADFETACRAFLENHPPRMIREIHKSAGKSIYKYVYERPTMPVRRKAYQIVNDCRHALDQSVFAATKIISGVKGNKTYFPFAADPTDFENLFQGKRNCSDVSEAIKPFLMSLEPWWPSTTHGGNLVLRTLGKISGPNKHQVALSTTMSIDDYEISSDCDSGVIFPYPPQRVEGKNEYIIAIAPLEGIGDLKGKIVSGITLADVPNLDQRVADDVLREMTQITSRIVSDIHAKVIEIVT